MTSSILILLFSMISIQSGASAAKALFPIVGPIGATLLRLSLASGVLLALWPPRRHTISRASYWAIARYGVSLGCMNLCFYLALDRIPLGIAVTLEFVGPLSLALFASRRVIDFLWAFLAGLGILLIYPHADTLHRSLDPIGIFFSLAAGFFWACYIVNGQKIGTTVDSKRATSVGMLFATLAVIPVGILKFDITQLKLQILPLALGVALLSSAIPYSLEMIAMQKIPTKTFGILMSLEPVMAILCGLVFLGERLTLVQWIAVCCVILASLGSALTSCLPSTQLLQDSLSETKA